MSELALVASALSSVLDSPVKTYDECVADNTISLSKTLDLSSIHGNSLLLFRQDEKKKDPSLALVTRASAQSIQIFVKTLFGNSQAMFVNTNDTVLELKRAIHNKLGYDITQMRLEFACKQLNDYRTIAYYNIQKGDNIYILFRLLGGLDFYVIKEDFLDPQYNFDFTNLNYDGITYTRGMHLYKRPYGWKRIALNVLGKYDSSDEWLGCTGDSSDEWAVSYHGTRREVVDSIADEGYLLCRGRQFIYGSGIYSSPEIEVAEEYATEFDHNGTRYKVVFQNRVNTVGLEKVDDIQYWITPEEMNIRPYGLCIKKVQ